MTMSIAQARVPKGLLKEANKLVEMGIYSNMSDVIRDAIRRLVLEKMTGIIPFNENSVKEVRELRRKLSKETRSFKDLERINKLSD
jgi:Arc/MetJ-type ribon-helix-helix transcriptional regulator